MSIENNLKSIAESLKIIALQRAPLPHADGASLGEVVSAIADAVPNAVGVNAAPVPTAVAPVASTAVVAAVAPVAPAAVSPVAPAPVAPVAPAPSAAAVASPSEVVLMTPDELNTALVAEFNRLKSREGIDQALATLGAANITELPVDKYAELVAMVQAL
jgi:hypothetical protein